ncbi:hypothetical protein RN70_00710 [Staphylococcus schleiferi]|uniref:DUF916 and DUF3324 domain-containing protein n=2 Tax=Staphylococcus coagulans TaxID=74706 RepID=UPI00067A2E9D|nr:DUF916 and DUF3324 domain-containing protein [Staphylococcus coagulans]AKS68170.1 hypothetical protein NP71_00650 [Staphylococcus schleiferi]AKS72549.1 hypothetical protein RN70_00710 [Staphylococcus schleiferi]MBT2832697.1 DUF916 and DUF3324 domain-containing protein [Staphylococcus coagulans]
MKKVITLFITCLLMFAFVTRHVYAKNDNVPFSVRAILPDNQVDKNVSYFNIEMAKGDTQDLPVELYNSSSNPVHLVIDRHFAATNSNGIITYDGSIKKHDASMKYPFEKISSIAQKEVTLSPGQTTTIHIKVQAPQKAFDGTILGGIYIKQKQDQQGANQGVQIQNQYAYAIAVQIQEKDNNTKVKPDLKLNDVKATTIDKRTGAQTDFINPTATIIKNLKFKGTIYKQGSDKALYERQVNDFDVAPNNRFHFPIMFDNQEIKPGKYTFKGNAQNKDHRWTFEKDFTVTDKDAKKANDDAIELDKGISIWWFIIPIALLIAIIVFILYLRRRKSQA